MTVPRRQIHKLDRFRGSAQEHRYIDFNRKLYPKAVRRAVELGSVPIGFLLSVITVTSLVHQGIHTEMGGAPQVVLLEYEYVRDKFYAALAVMVPWFRIATYGEDGLLAWLFFGWMNFNLFHRQCFLVYIREFINAKTLMLADETYNDPGTDDARDDNFRIETIGSLEGHLFQYPWMFRYWIVWVALGPIIHLVMLYKVFFPSFLVKRPENRAVVWQHIVTTTALLWGVLALALANAATILYWDYLVRLAASV